MNPIAHENELTGWWLLFREGDKDAFAAIYTRFYPRLYAYGLKFTANDEQIRDIIQDLFAKLYAKPDLVGNAGTLHAFLFASFRNACIDYVRNVFRQVDILTVPDIELPFDVACDAADDPEEEAHVRQQVQTILNSLTPRQREIVYLRFLHQLDYEEISRIMHLSEQASRNLIHRAFAYIRKNYRR